MNKKPVILLTDIGGDIDDTWALGLLLKSPELDLKLLVTETEWPESKARIACKFLDRAGRGDIPVALGVGSSRKEDNQSPWAADYTLDDYPTPVRADGVGALIEYIRSSPEPVTLISIAPVPTLAAALKKAPDIAQKAHLIGMHGCVRKVFPGFDSVKPEYNVWADVPSWKIVYAAPWLSVAITPLDTCGIVQLTDEWWRRMLAGRQRPILNLILENYRVWLRQRGEESLIDVQSSILYDTVAVYMAISLNLLKMERLQLYVDDDGLMKEDGEGPSFTLDCAMAWTSLDSYYAFLIDRLTEA